MADEGARASDLSPLGMLGALRLGSAALPIGAFAYSQALEQATELGRVRDADSAERWICGMLRQSVLSADVPLLSRAFSAWSSADHVAVERASALLLALRGARELRDEERQLGRSLFRLLSHLGVTAADPWMRAESATLASAYALAALHWAVPRRFAAASYAFAWTEAQVGAATRLVPLGQHAAQRVLGRALHVIADGLDAALVLEDDEIAASAPGQALLSAAHETQYSRLFRS
jgi:urease accessory protein